MVSQQSQPARLACTLALTTLLISSPLAAQNEYERQPIPNEPGVKTSAAYRAGLYRYYSRIAAQYQERTEDTDEARAAGVRLFTKLSRKQAFEPNEASESYIADVKQLTQAAIDAGSTDVLVIQRHARILSMDGEYDTAKATLLECETRLAGSGYPTIAHMLNSLYLCALEGLRPDAELRAEYFPLFLDRFSKWLAEETRTPEHRRYVFDLAYRVLPVFASAEEMEAILEALKRHGGIDAWFLDTFTGATEIEVAWAYRTTRLSVNVSQARWKQYHAHLRIANQHLRRAWAAEPDYPEAAAFLITVAMGLGDDAIEPPRVWFDRAVAAEMDHPPAYRRFKTGLRPRWGGSHQKMSQFGLECLATKRFDTDVPYLLFDQVLAVEWETGWTDRYWTRPKVYAKLREMFEGYLNEPAPPAGHPSLRQRKKILTTYAAVAARTRRWSDCVRAMDNLGGDVDEAMLKTMQVTAHHIATAYASTGEHKQVVAEVESLAKTRSVDALGRAIALLADAESKNRDERASPYFVARKRLLGELHDFQRGEWAELSFDESLTGWRAKLGEWSRESDRSVIGTRNASVSRNTMSPLSLYSLHRFEPPYQLQLDVEELNGNSFTGVGVAVGDVSFGGGEARGRFCYAHADAVGSDAGVRQVLDEIQRKLVSHKPGEPARFHFDLRVWPRSFVMLVNNDGPYNLDTTGFHPGLEFALAARQQVSDGIRFSNVRIRKISYRSLRQHQGVTESLALSTQMISHDPGDWLGYWMRGSDNFQLERYEDALRDFQVVQRLNPDYWGVSYMLGMTYSRTKDYGKAVEMFEAAVAKEPTHYRVLHEWAELELTAEDPQFRNPQSALEHASEAAALTSGLWQYELTAAKAYAATGDPATAVEIASQINTTDSVSQAQVHEQLVEFRKLKGRSLRVALASLLWEGDMTTRVIGIALVLVLLAANMTIIKKVAKFGRLTSAATGLFGIGMAVAIPSALAVLFGVGEGPAFIGLLAAIVGVAAIGGAFAGLRAAAKAESRAVSGAPDQ